jgi:hypothetical protein
MNKIAIMQPYIFPYIGYFQMVNAVDKFVFYDDVNYINRGWINRNRILINNEPKYITVELIKASQNKLINEIEVGNNINKLINSISLAYKKAPYYKEVFPVIENCLNYQTNLISELAIQSVISVSEYLNLPTQFEVSSELYADSKGIDKADRLIHICKKNDATHYINAIGGIELYNKEYFSGKNITLKFIKCYLSSYKQFNDEFVPGLSIIDVLMFNDIESCQKILNQFELI